VEGEASMFQRSFPKTTGISVSESGDIFVSCVHSVLKFHNVSEKGQKFQDKFDAVYLPKSSNTTAEIDTHDIGLDKDEKIWIAVTAFSCVAETSRQYSFLPRWKPSFITDIMGDDRCHLTGLAMRDGAPRYVSCAAETNNSEGWRSQKISSGVVIDIQNDYVVCKNLSLPHSPRFYHGRLYCLNSGKGEFGYIEDDCFHVIAWCPGFLRGLTFYQDYAIVGSSLVRATQGAGELPIETKLKEMKMSSRCGLFIVNLKSGTIDNWIQFKGMVTELFDVGCLPGVETPYAVGFRNQEICQIVHVPQHNTIEEKLVWND
jgi:uncharacterized protein (TIGR03032 family)